MSRNEPDDDFFGIQYISSSQSTNDPSFSEQPKKAVNPNNSSPQFPTESELKDLSGSEFLDAAFFPGVKNNSTQTTGSSPEESNLFEDQYFEKAKIAENVLQQSIKDVRSTELDEQKIYEKKRAENYKKYVQESTPWDEIDEINEDSGEDGFHRYNGLAEIRSHMNPVWGLTIDQQIQYMSNRVLHNDQNVIAFDKPYGMAYSGGPSYRPQFDRILQKVKALVAPKVERLYLVQSLDRHTSGVLLFATNSLIQSELKESCDRGDITRTYRCIVRGSLPNSPLKINIPLIKQIKNKDMKMVPLLDSKTRREVLYVESNARIVSGNEYCSHIDITTTREVPHQVRAHLSLAGCPLIGDTKYSADSPRPPKLADQVKNLLGVTGSQTSRLPMMLHLKEVSLPSLKGTKPLHIRSPTPDHIMFVLKKLRLLKK